MNFGLKDPHPRTLCVMETPNIADAAGLFPIVEYDPSQRPEEGTMFMYHSWSGWRPRLIRWLIQRLLPEPTIYRRIEWKQL